MIDSHVIGLVGFCGLLQFFLSHFWTWLVRCSYSLMKYLRVFESPQRSRADGGASKGVVCLHVALKGMGSSIWPMLMREFTSLFAYLSYQ